MKKPVANCLFHSFSPQNWPYFWLKTAGTKIENFGFMHHFRMSILSMFHDSKGRLVVVLCDLPCFYSENQQIKPIFWSNMTLKFSKSAQNLSQTPTPPTKQNLRCSGFATGNCRNLIYGSSLSCHLYRNSRQLVRCVGGWRLFEIYDRNVSG